MLMMTSEMHSHREKPWLHLSPNKIALKRLWFIPGVDTVWAIEFSNTIPENNEITKH